MKCIIHSGAPQGEVNSIWVSQTPLRPPPLRRQPSVRPFLCFKNVNPSSRVNLHLNKPSANSLSTVYNQRNHLGIPHATMTSHRTRQKRIYHIVRIFNCYLAVASCCLSILSCEMRPYSRFSERERGELSSKARLDEVHRHTTMRFWLLHQRQFLAGAVGRRSRKWQTAIQVTRPLFSVPIRKQDEDTRKSELHFIMDR